MLDTTLAEPSEVGSNLPGGRLGLGWLYALPDLKLESVLCVGRPSQAAIETLSRHSRLVVVLPKLRHTGQRRWVTLRRHGADVVSTSRQTGATVGGFDLVFGSEGFLRRVVGRSSRWHRRALRLVAPTGVVYDERYVRKPASGARASNTTLMLAPSTGEVQAAAPAAQPQLFEKLGGRQFPATARRPMLRRVHSVIGWPRATVPLVDRVATLEGPNVDGFQQVPRWLRHIAAASGVDLQECAWTLLAAGRYRSKKALFRLYDSATLQPRYVVKLTRSTEYNSRLERAWEASNAIHELPVRLRDGVPKPAFFGFHAGLAVLGEQAVDGVGLDEVHGFAAQHDAAQAAASWFGTLATATRTMVDSHEWAGALFELRTRFEHIYELPAEQRRFLDGQLQTLTERSSAIPAVMQHGDPQVPNLLAAGSRVYVLDWEASEDRGVPLWDILHLAESYGRMRTRATGRGLAAAGDGIHRSAEARQLLASVIPDTCRVLGIPPDLSVPLFYGCWVHRAVREATRLHVAGLHKGYYVRMLQTWMRPESAEGLHRLLVGDLQWKNFVHE